MSPPPRWPLRLIRIIDEFNLSALEKLPREALEGKKVEAVGAYPLPSKGQLPLLTPATIVIGG